MKKHSLTLLTLILTFSVKAQIGAFDSLVGAYNAQHSFNGVALLAVNGKVLHNKAIGVANMDTKKPISLESKFRIASMTKVFIAIMVMKLVEDHEKLGFTAYGFWGLLVGVILMKSFITEQVQYLVLHRIGFMLWVLTRQ